MCRFPFGSDSCDGLWRMTLGTELAGHPYPDSPRRIQVLRWRRALHRHGYWLRAALRRNRHDNPVSRVSATLSTESHQSRRNPGIRCAATLLAASRTFERSLLDPRSWAVPPTAKDPPTRIHGFANSAPRVRCNDHTNEARDAEMKGLSSTPKRQRTNRDEIEQHFAADRWRRTLSPECQQPSHENVRNPVRNPPTAGQAQRSRTRECLTAGDTRKKRTSK